MKRRLAIVAVLICLALLAGCSEPLTPEENISATLERLGAGSAEDAGTAEWLDIGQFRKYEGEDGTEYYFDPETGDLRIVHNFTIDRRENTEPAEPEARRQAALGYAESCLGEKKLGELQIDREHFSNVDYRYQIVEYYDDIPTGTQVSLTLTEDGRMIGMVVTYGTVFEKTWYGAERKNDADQITEEEAIRIAEAYAQELCGKNDHTYVGELVACALEGKGELLFYSVELTALENGWEITYMIIVDAYTGEVIEWARSL